MIKKCKHCQEDFEPVGGPKRYCPKCIKVNLICEECKKPFQITRAIYQFNVNKRKHWFCSEECVHKNQRESFKGEKNHFYGGVQSEETKDKIREAHKRNIKIYKSESFRDKISNIVSGKGNPFFGKHHTEETKDKLRKENLGKHSGSKNPMYGKPSPRGSGNGWSGWYKDWFFRSIKELSFMIKVIERFKFKWVSGESKIYKISYRDWNGKERNYFPDFILNNIYMVEVKPKKLWESVSVSLKKKSAELFCQKKGMNYRLLDPPLLKIEEIQKYYNDGTIKFLPRYEEKFLKLIKEK